MQRFGGDIAQRAGGLALGLWLLGGAPSPGIAQTRGLRDVWSWGRAGGGVVAGVPVGEFRDFVDFAGGVRGFFTVNLNRGGTAGVRLAGSYLLYGNERRLVPLAGTGGLVALDLNTSFYVASLGAGPQLTFGTGRARLYGFGTVGVSYFATETSLGCCYGPSTVNFDDAALALEGGGGLLVALSRGRHPILLDLGASYVRNGEVRFLTEGGIVQNPDGSVTFFPVQSDANFVTLQVGVSVGLR